MIKKWWNKRKRTRIYEERKIKENKDVMKSQKEERKGKMGRWVWLWCRLISGKKTTELWKESVKNTKRERWKEKENEIW